MGRSLRLLTLLDEASGNAPTLRRLLRRFRHRVDRMRREITRAMLADPNPLSLEDILAQLAATQPAPQAPSGSNG